MLLFLVFFFLSLSGRILRLRQGTAEDCLGLAEGRNSRLCRDVSFDDLVNQRNLKKQ